MRGTILVLLGAACSGGEGLPDNTPAIASGSRLKAMWWVDSDGHKLAPAADGWFDSQLGIPCRLDYADDGKLRCLPRTFAGALRSRVQYADAACTRQAVFGGFSPTEACPSAYNPMTSDWAYGPAPPPACHSGYPAVRITGNLPASPTSYYRDATGRCVAEGVWPFGYTIGPALPATTFVAFGDPAPSGPGRLQPMYLMAEDGAREWVGIWDAMRGQRCTPALASDGQKRCLPSASGAFFYLDAQCTQPLVFLAAVDCPSEAPNVLFGEQTECGTHTLREGGAPMTPSAVYFNGSGTCRPWSMPIPSGTFYTVGAVIPPQRFVALSDVTLARGRIVAHALAGDAEVVQPPQLLHDTKLDADVGPSPVDSQTVVLLPAESVGVSLYADAGCTQAIAEVPASCGRTPRFGQRDRDEAMGCWSRHVYELSGPIDPPAVFEGIPGMCSPATKPSRPLFELAAELSRSTFVPVTMMHE